MFQVMLLVILATIVSLDLAGWVTGITYGVLIGATLTWGLHYTGARALGPADWVTLVRASLVGCVTVLTADSFRTPVPVRLLVGIATVALALDWLDGQVARRTGTVSPLGTRFDYEIDAFLLLVLSAYVATSLGIWVVAIGAMRYAFLTAGRILPWLRAPLPSTLWGKTVAVVQGIVLVVAAAGVLPHRWTVTMVALSLALLVESFSHSVVFLWRRRAAYVHSGPGSEATGPKQIHLVDHADHVERHRGLARIERLLPVAQEAGHPDDHAPGRRRRDRARFGVIAQVVEVGVDRGLRARLARARGGRRHHA
jgi:phosphatidylglycerophosphate synthase